MESAADKDPTEGAAVAHDIEKPSADSAPSNRMLRMSTDYDEYERVTADCDLGEESRNEEQVARGKQHLERLKREALQMPSHPLAGWPWPGLTGLQSLAIFEERHQRILRDMKQVKGMEEQAKEAKLESLFDTKAAALGKQEDCVSSSNKGRVTNRLIRRGVWKVGCPT